MKWYDIVFVVVAGTLLGLSASCVKAPPTPGAREHWVGNRDYPRYDLACNETGQVIGHIYEESHTHSWAAFGEVGYSVYNAAFENEDLAAQALIQWSRVEKACP